MSDDEQLRVDLLKMVPRDKCYDPESHIAYAHMLYCWVTRRSFQPPHRKPSVWQKIAKALTPIQK